MLSLIESVKTTSTENVRARVVSKTKENYLKGKDEAKKSYVVLRRIYLHKSRYQKIMKIYSPLCQSYSPTVDFKKVGQHTGGKWLIQDTKRRKDNQL